MGADVEVGQRRSARALGTAVLQESLAGEEAGFPRQLEPGEGFSRQGRVQLLDALEADRNLGVDDGVDAQLGPVGAGIELRRRSLIPVRIVCQHVQQDVGVHQDAPGSGRRRGGLVSRHGSAA